ncbi:MAG: transcription antitermination factor NusB [Pseudomonadota bacterium]
MTPRTRPVGRRQARRTALVLLFQWDVTGQELGSLYGAEVDAWALALAREVAADAERLDATISDYAEDWTADRLGAVERNVLRIALKELERGEVPMEVALDEAVRLAKRYASDEAAKLVNGILGRAVRERAA